MNKLKTWTFILPILIVSLSLQGCGDDKKKLNGRVVKTDDGRFFLIHHHIGDTYFIRPLDVDKAKATAAFIQKEK